MSSEDEPIAKNGKANDSSDDDASSSEDDVPISQCMKKSISKAKQDDDDEEESSSGDDDVPIAAAKKKKSAGSVSSASSPCSSSSSSKKRKRFDDSDESGDDEDDDIASSSEDDVPIIKAAQQIKTAKAKSKKAAKSKSKPPAKKKARHDHSSDSNTNSPSSSAASTPRKRKKSSSSVPGYVGRECNDSSNYAVKDSIVPLQPEKGALKWWEHEDDSAVSYSAKDDSKSKVKWNTLDHNGVVFAPEYEAHGVPLKYDGRVIRLTPDQEEICSYYGVMTETDWVQKPKFRKNFMKEFVKILTDKRQARQFPEIVDLSKCDFAAIMEWWKAKKEREKEAKKVQEYKDRQKAERADWDSKYGFALVDGILEKVGNYKVEPPGLFRGRGEHPKMGLLKQRILPKHIILNIGENTLIPPCPIAGQKWGGVIHDKTVTYIAKWVENINGQHKFVYLGASSRFKGQNDRNKYEKARVLKTKIAKIRKDYESKLTSKSLMEKQLATAVWMIDKLSIRVGNEKDTDEEADTVGVCSLRKEHMTLLDPSEVKKQKRKQAKHKHKKRGKKLKTKNSDSDEDDDDDDGPDSESDSEDDEPIAAKRDSSAKEYKITLDFLGKDSMRYHQTVSVTRQVYMNLRSFLSGKKDDMDIFEKIDPNKVNDYLRDQMEGLTAKVFRTHNASTTLQAELAKGYHPNCGHIGKTAKIEEKIYFYNQCNMQVAIMCNHQRSVSKTHAEQLQKMDTHIQDMKNAVAELEEEHDIVTGKKKAKKKPTPKKKKKKKDEDEEKAEEEEESPSKKKRPRTAEQLEKLIQKKQQMLRKKELQKAMKEDNKEVALGTSKINYMDPRITVSWCKLMQVPIEKIFNKSLLDKFPWAMQSKKKYIF